MRKQPLESINKIDNILKYIVNIVRASVIPVIIYSVIGLSGVLGSRGIKEDYKFNYLGKSAAVKHDDRRFWFDEYFIESEGLRINCGSIKADSGETIEIQGYKGTRMIYNVQKN